MNLTRSDTDAQSTTDAAAPGTSRSGSATLGTVETTPSTKPTIAKLGGTFLGGLLAVGIVASRPDLFGGPRVAEIVGNLLLLLTGIGVVRLLVQWYVLTRTRYVVSPEGVRREYTLLYRTWSRELPLSMIRSHELSRTRLQTLFGVGTVEFLSGSVAGSIGHVEFDHLPDPTGIREAVRERSTAGDAR